MTPTPQTKCVVCAGDVQISMTWNEAAALYETLSKQWHKPGSAAAEFVRVLGERLKERPKT